MSDLNTENTKALSVQFGADVINLLDFFSLGGPEINWDNWLPGESPAFLENLKVGLVGLANVVEVRLQEIYAPDHEQTDFGV